MKKLKNPKAFIDYSQTIDDVYEILEDYNLTKKRRALIMIDDMIADMDSKKNLSFIVTELSLNISLVFILRSYFKVPQSIRLNATHYFILKVRKKRELQQIASNNLSEMILKIS